MSPSPRHVASYAGVLKDVASWLWPFSMDGCPWEVPAPHWTHESASVRGPNTNHLPGILVLRVSRFASSYTNPAGPGPGPADALGV
jgi:hypothetical protein